MRQRDYFNVYDSLGRTSPREDLMSLPQRIVMWTTTIAVAIVSGIALQMYADHRFEIRTVTETCASGTGAGLVGLLVAYLWRWLYIRTCQMLHIRGIAPNAYGWRDSPPAWSDSHRSPTKRERPARSAAADATSETRREHPHVRRARKRRPFGRRPRTNR